MEDYTDDVATLVRTAKSENPGVPVFVLGHSVGGAVACIYTLDDQSEIDGLICESFAYDLPVPEIVLLFIKGLSYITPHTHVFPLKNEIFSRDPLVVDSMNNDPLIQGESQPFCRALVIRKLGLRGQIDRHIKCRVRTADPPLSATDQPAPLALDHWK